MNTKNKVFAGLVAATAVAGVGVATMGAASAATLHPHTPVRVSVGSVELGGSALQYEQFVTVQGAGHNHGFVDYTNWAEPNTGTGVWAPEAAAHALTFFNGTPSYVHTLNAGLVLKADSNTKLEFSGTGSYPSVPWTIKGQVHRAKVSFTITYNAPSTYSVKASGLIAADGSASGTAKGSDGQALTWTMPAKSFGEVMQFTTRVTSDKVNVGTRTDTFTWTVPASAPAGIAGLKVTVKVHEGRHGLASDTYAHGVTGGPLSGYPIEAGSLYIP
jgi:hypothetical protein